MHQESNDSPSETGSDLGTGKPLHGNRVLLIDDDEFNLELFSEQLEILGLVADTASDGSDGLELFLRNRYSAVLTDCRMPGMDGYELSRRIREHEKEKSLERTLILGITGGDGTGCREAGMDGVLNKPVTLEQLRSALL